MTELIPAINLLLATFKTAKELFEKSDSTGLKSQLLAMNEQLLDMKEIALALRDENISLREELKKIKEFEDRGLTLKKDAYFDKNDNGPYCPTCWDNEKYLSMMRKPLSEFPPACPRCKYSLDR